MQSISLVDPEKMRRSNTRTPASYDVTIEELNQRRGYRSYTTQEV